MRGSARIAGIIVALALVVAALAPSADASIRALVPARIRGLVPARIRGLVPARGFASSLGHGSLRSAIADSGGPLVYNGGPVVRGHRVYRIYWDPAGTFFGTSSAESTAFESTVDGYFTNVAADSGGIANPYGSAAQYADTTGPGQYSSQLGGRFDDTSLYPFDPACKDQQGLPPLATAFCLTQDQIQTEIKRVVELKGWQTGLGSIFFLFTPKGVGSCAAGNSVCAYSGKPGDPPGGYCAYHNDYLGARPLDGETLYAYMPYQAVAECDDYQRPNGTTNGGADAEINVASHEHIETITDPLGSLCPLTGPCPADKAGAWYDRTGAQGEIADKCTAPFFTDLVGPGSPQGPALGGSPGAPPASTGTLFTQSIAGGRYYMQREYSNLAGGCVQRVVPASFAASVAGLAVAFDGSTSGAVDDPVATYSWDFGDGNPTGSGTAPKHSYAVAGNYPVKLTVTDARGNVNTLTQNVAVTDSGPQVAIPGPPPPGPAPAPQTTTPPPPPVVRISSSSLAALFRRASFTLAGLTSPFSLASAACPPHCTLRATLITEIRSHGRRKTLTVGSGTLSLAAGQSGRLRVRLNATGRSLLRKRLRLRVTVLVRASDSLGSSAQVAHALTLHLKTRRH